MLSAVLLFFVSAPAAVCPITGAEVDDQSPAAAISGVQFRFKDEASRKSFLLNPRECLAKASEKGWVVGVSFFDPVMRKSMILSRDGQIRKADIQAVKAWTPYAGILYPMGGPRSQNVFQRNPAAWTAPPSKYSLWCPYMQKAVPSIERSVGYFDFDSVRYFVCCETCLGQSQRGGASLEEARTKALPWIALNETK